MILMATLSALHLLALVALVAALMVAEVQAPRVAWCKAAWASMRRMKAAEARVEQ